ncbi:MAG TPA: hypothetical protein VK582_03870 [Pyrinomonadaceae bacterium]|nr:hypothetical protein [Pyrinomonadaceae bacterium]
MQIALSWFLTALAVAVLVWALWTRKLLILRDWFFTIYFVDVLVHLHLFPTLYLQASNLVAFGVINPPDDELAWYYVIIQLAAIILFEWPFLFLYLRGVRPFQAAAARKHVTTRVVTTPGKAFFLSIVSIVFTLTYLTVALRFGLLRMPRDNAAIPYLLLGLWAPVYATLRLFVYSGLFLTAVLLVTALQTARLFFLTRVLIWTAFGLTAGVWLLQALLFSRWEVTFGIIVLIGVLLSQKQWLGTWYKTIQRRKMKRIVFVGVLLLLYAMRITYNYRYNYVETEGLKLENLNPFISYEIPYYEDQDFRWRLNGLDLMARITPRAMNEGYALGAGWEYAFYSSVGQWVPGLSVADYKLNPLTDTKAYLEYRYTGYRLSDWPNSFLTDLYGNFSFPGFILAALLLSQVLVFVNRTLSEPRTFRGYLLALFFISQTMMFENSFSGWLFGLLRPGPILLLLLILRPFRIISASKASEPSSRPLTHRSRLSLPSPSTLKGFSQ